MLVVVSDDTPYTVFELTVSAPEPYIREAIRRRYGEEPPT
jgi:hypothetical protein